VRIDMVSRFGWPCINGVQTVLRTLANELCKNHDVRCFAQRIDAEGIEFKNAIDQVPKWPTQVDPASGVTTSYYGLRQGRVAALAPVLFSPRRYAHRVPLYPKYLLALDRYYAAIAAPGFANLHKGADLVHRFGGNRVSLATVRAAHRLGIPAVIQPSAHPGQWDDDATSATAYREADLVIAVNALDKLTYTDLGVPDERVAICPHATPAPRSGGGPALRSRHGITGRLVLFLGVRRGEYKGAHILLDAAALLRDRYPDVRFAFVGPGPALPPAPNVVDAGAVDDAERDAWLEAADIVSLPSSNEAYGLAVSEAWSVAAPVVTSDIQVLKERVGECGGGMAVPRTPRDHADAIACLLSDDNMRHAMGSAGFQQWQGSLSPEASAAWHIERYGQLIEGARRR
jgi:glycosyltransferase involved in cell wall biosynthesis